MEFDISAKLLPNIITLAVQWGATFILYLVFKKYLYKSVVNWLDKRAEMSQQDLHEAAQQKEAAFEMSQKATQEYQQVLARADEIIKDSNKQAIAEKEALLQQASNEAATIREKAKHDIELERKEMLANIQEEIIDVAMEASTKLLNKEVDAKYQKEALESFLSELRS